MENDKRVSILIVEDDDSSRSGLAILLEEDGFDIDTVSDGRQGMEKISLKDYDIIITDINMPCMGGLEFIRQARGISNGSIIVMTAYGDVGTYREALDYGAFEYINKPVEYNDLLLLINRIMKGEDDFRIESPDRTYEQ